MTLLLQDLEIYTRSDKLSNRIWKLVSFWDPFAKFGIGKQLTSSVDSISINIAEGYGRYFIKENIQFCYYSRGSLFEAKSWLNKSFQRDLINQNDFDEIINELDLIHIKLNAYLKVLKQNLNKVNKPQ